jgi:hypothetical protein
MASRNGFSNEKRQKVYLMFDGKCAYCGEDINFRSFVIDHITPIARGGSNKIDNLFPSCNDCNACKTYLDLEQFREKLKNFYGKEDFKYKMLIKYYNVKPKNKKFSFYFERVYKEVKNGRKRTMDKT